MRKKLIKKLIGMSAAASLGCSAVISSGAFFMSSSAAEARPAAENVVDVIVKLKGDALLDAPAAANMGTDFIRTPGAAAITADLKASQKAVQDSIRSIYPDIEVKTEFFITVNGFECELPKSAIPAVEALPGVDYVYESKTVSLPQMSNAVNYAAIPQFYQETGCYGEGKVVAVIDSELDITHPMFSELAPDIKTSLTKDDLKFVIDNIGLNVDISADDAYLNSKVPYCANYTGDPYGDVPDDRSFVYHGTHVSGIAVGNEFEDENGTVCAGVAKDAQLVFMSIQNPYGPGLPDPAILAAFEDAIKLGSDVISMSFGGNSEEYDNYLLRDASLTAEKAGIVLLRAAGNEGNNGNTSVDKPDDGTVNCFNEDSVLSVASADNDIDYNRYTCSLSLGGEEIKTNPIYDESGNHVFLSDFAEGDMPYEFFEKGTEEEFEGVDLTDKIAVIQVNDEIDMFSQVLNAHLANAVGMILVDIPGREDIHFIGTDFTPVVIVTYEEGMKLKDAKDKTITIEKVLDDVMDYGISDFSSWGPTVNLDLRPDITGMGGGILSASYNSSLERMDGTSMATPFTAGCAAVLLEYLEKNGMDQKTPERTQYLRKLMMNSAELMKDGDMYISPRQQGAGLVSLGNAVNEKVFLTGADGNAKIKLYDDIDDSFTFTVDAENFSDEDVAFSSAKLVLATNGYDVDEETGEYFLSGQISLNSKSDLSQLTTLKAGEKKSLSIDCKLDKEQLEQIGEVFQNGFYVYGFIVLEGAENCCDTSIPVLGFRGHWNDAPILNEDSLNPYTVIGDRTFESVDSFLACVKYWAEFSEQLPEDTELNADNYQELILENGSEEMIDEFTRKPEKNYVSNDNNGINDVLAFDMLYERFAQVDINITNSKGEVVFEMEPQYSVKDMPQILSQVLDSELPEGDYTYNATMHTGYGNYPEEAQVFSYDFTIDNSDPELSAEITVNKDGRRILKVTASDDQALDGVVIYGEGKGKLAGSKTENTINYLAAANSMLDVINDSHDVSDYNYSASERKFMEYLLAGWIDESVFDVINYSDIILPGEDGTVSFEYDITDLDVYAVIAADKAFNTTKVSVDVNKEAEEIRSGVWVSDGMLFQFNEDGSVDIKINGVEGYTGKYSDGVLTVYRNGELTDTMNVTNIYDYYILFENGDGAVISFEYLSDESIDDVELFDINEMAYGVCEAHLKSAGERNGEAHPYYYFDYDCLGGTEFEIRCYYNYDPNSDSNVVTDLYFADTYTGEVYDSNGSFIDVFDKTITDFTPFQKGMWVSNTNNELSYLFFDAAKMNGYIENASDKSITYFDYYFNDDGSIQLIIDDDEINANAEMFMYLESTILTLTYEDGSCDVYSFDYSLRPLRFDIFDYSELTRMSIKDYTSKHEGSAPTEANFRANEDNTVDIELSKNGEVVETYNIDPVTAKGSDSDFNEVELPQTGSNVPLTAAETAASILLMIGGAFAVVKSGMFRRRDEE